MNLEVDICPMIISAKKKWESIEDDERTALNYAFTDAICHFERIAEYRHYSLRLRRGIVHMHWFRIGHAIFEIAVFRNYCPIIIDIAWVT
jgi:hypothetical protein